VFAIPSNPVTSHDALHKNPPVLQDFGERARVGVRGCAGISAKFARARPFDVRQNEVKTLLRNELRHKTTKKLFDPLRTAKNPCKTRFSSPGNVVEVQKCLENPQITRAHPTEPPVGGQAESILRDDVLWSHPTPGELQRVGVDRTQVGRQNTPAPNAPTRILWGASFYNPGETFGCLPELKTGLTATKFREPKIGKLQGAMEKRL
jgi:hypothetical protein